MPHPVIPRERVATGVPGLDRVLAGGLLRSGFYLVEGSPGTGKTILASQIAFHCARQGDRVLLVSVLAEPHGKLLHHLRDLSFFDEETFSRSITLLSGYEQLATGGLDGLMSFIVTCLREHRPALLVLEGFASVRSYGVMPSEFARFVHQLSTLVMTTRCTTLAVGSTSGEGELRPEHTLVDGLIELDLCGDGMRRERELEVRKMRATNHLRGRHAFAIGPDGIRVFARLEALGTRLSHVPDAGSRRLLVGVDGLDDMIGGGLVEGSSTRLLGPPGAGKTLLGLQFLAAGASVNERGLYFGFYESPPRLLLKAAAVGMNVAGPATDGTLRLQWQPPLELLLDELGERLLSIVRDSGIQRVFIDGIESFREGALHPERFPLFAIALTTELRALNVTTVFAEELEQFGETPGRLSFGASALIENMILLRYLEIDSGVRRLISISKLRDSDFDPAIREFIISVHGLRVGAPFTGLERTSTGRAHAASRSRPTAGEARKRAPRRRAGK